MTDATSQTAPAHDEDPAAGDTLDGFVGRHAGRLWHGYAADRPDAASELARLRRALPRRGFMPPDAWMVFERGFPHRLRGHGDEPSRAELAAGTSLSLFALHQQSKRDRPMHVRGANHSLGKAVYALQLRADTHGVERRIQALTRSNGLDPLVEHLRALVTQLRSESIPLDYARLALDLHQAQSTEGVRGVRTRWMRDFYRPRPQASDATTTSEEST